MCKNLLNQIIRKAFLFVSILPISAYSQVDITSPSPRAVYQQDITGQRAVPISGKFSIPVDKIEVRGVPVLLGQGEETPWGDLDLTPEKGVFSGTIKLKGGWYTIEIRATNKGNVVGRDILERLGVGEVFLIAGQSNAQGLHKYPGPSASDDRVVYVSNYSNDVQDLLTDPPAPQFSRVTTDLSFMSPRGQGAWCWGILGDLLVAKLNVPILFINTAWEGTSSENWAKSAQGLPTKNMYGGFTYNPGMPYANLRIAAKNYANQYGVRGILWMQGETDGLFRTPATQYRDNLQTVMNILGSDTGKRITWVIARTSRTAKDSDTPSSTNPEIIAAQNSVIDASFNPTYAGPETDPLDPERSPDHTHFNGASLPILANAWNNSLDANFFSRVPPVAPAAVPEIAATCVTANNAVTITLPGGYSSYQWSNGATGPSITVTQAGSYRATVKDNFGNSILSPIVTLDNNALPVTPSINQQGQQQACADSSFTFSVNGDNDIFNWFKDGGTTPVATGSSVKISESGSYFVRRENIFGCKSGNSANSSLTIQPKISNPLITSAGPFSITASIDQPGLNEQYIWQRPGIEGDTIANVIKVVKSGDYTAQAKATFTIGNNSIVCYSDTSTREFKTNESNDVVIYPNPSQEAYIYIESRDPIKDATVTMYDLFGRILSVQTIPSLNSRFQINVSSLPTGKYVLRVVGATETLTKQIVIK